MYTKEHYNEFWGDIIRQLPKGGSYRFDMRAEGYQKIMDLIPEGSKVFDYACGLAMVSIKLAKEKKCVVAGCDFSDVAVKFAKEKSGGDFRTTDKVFGGPYDYIILSHYLEHVKDPAEMLRVMFKKAKNIIVSLPNNFRRVGEHVNMQWGDWDEFKFLFKEFSYERVDNGYSTKTHHAWHRPIFLFKGDHMHPIFREEKPKKEVKKTVKKVKKTAKKTPKKVEVKANNDKISE